MVHNTLKNSILTTILFVILANSTTFTMERQDLYWLPNPTQIAPTRPVIFAVPTYDYNPHTQTYTLAGYTYIPANPIHQEHAIENRQQNHIQPISHIPSTSSTQNAPDIIDILSSSEEKIEENITEVRIEEPITITTTHDDHATLLPLITAATHLIKKMPVTPSDAPTQETKKRKKQQPVMCEYCNREFSNSGGLTTHKRSCGSKKNTPSIKNYHCQLCTESFKTEYKLNRHFELEHL